MHAFLPKAKEKGIKMCMNAGSANPILGGQDVLKLAKGSCSSSYIGRN